MSAARAILKNALALALARVIERLSNLVLIFFIARALGADDLGVYSAAIAYFALIGVAGAMGSTNLIVREIAKDRSLTNSYVVHFGVMAIVGSAAIMALSWVILPHLGYSDELRTGFVIVTAAVVPGALNTIQEAVFVAHQRVEFQTCGTFVASVVTIGASLYLLAAGYGVVSLIVTFVAVQWIVTACYFLLINRYITRLRWEFRRATARRLLDEMKAFAALSVLAAVFAQPEILILSVLSTEAQIGFYSAALKIVNIWQILPQTVMVNVFPVLSRLFHRADRRFEVVQEKSIKYLLAAALPVAAGISVAAEPIVELFFGSGFGPSVTALRILAWTIPLFSINSVLWRVLVARGKQATVVRVMAINVAARLAAGVLLIASFTSLGAAVATLVIALLHNVLLGVFIRREGLELHTLRLGARFALAALGMGVLTWVLVSEVGLWLAVPLAGLAYAALVWLLRALDPEDIALLRSVRRAGPRDAPLGSQQ